MQQNSSSSVGVLSGMIVNGNDDADKNNGFLCLDDEWLESTCKFFQKRCSSSHYKNNTDVG